MLHFNSINRPMEAYLNGKSTYKIRKVVLDAGHGGKDPGCIGASAQEKHNALSIVLKLGALIEQHHPDVQVIYTRKTDVFVELNERANIANRNNADLFVSVHCNAVGSADIHGTETYVLGLHRAADNLEVAKRENAAIFLEDNYEKNYGGYDPNSPEALILTSMWQSAYLEQSILFASFVQKHAAQIANRRDRGVKQAGFLVLRANAMPSVLVESGYLTNRSEDAYLASETGRNQMAMAIFKAFGDYKSQMEGTTQRTATPEKSTPAKTPPAGAAAQAEPATGYRILVASWPLRLDTSTGQLSKLKHVKEERIDGQYYYFVGTFAEYALAEQKLKEVRQLGFRTSSIQSLAR
jgi:N-acetylmuramoyl-L-alanine amidase